MQTSRTRKILLAILLSAVCFFVANSALTFLLEPYGSKSEITWTDYQAAEKIDTLVVGTSLAHHAIDPAVLDETCGSSSFNMATPNQTLEESLIGIETAYEDFGIKRVVIGVSAESLENDDAPNPSSAFLRQRGLAKGFGPTVATTVRVLFEFGAATQDDSLNCLFPWVSNHVEPGVSTVVDNARMKLDGTTVYEAAAANEVGWVHQGAGYGAVDKVLDYNGDALYQYADAADLDEKTAEAPELSDARLNTLAQIFAFCDAHGIELVAIGVPLPTYNVVEDGHAYFVEQAEIARVLAENGVAYYDFNLARSELFESHPEYFMDALHFNGEGGSQFTRSLGTFLNRLDAGEDVEALFYDEEGFLASVDSVQAIAVRTESLPEGLCVRASALTGPQVEVEYQMSVRSDDGGWMVARGWSTEPTWLYEGCPKGAVSIRIDARRVGSSEPFERFREMTVLY